MTKKYRPYFTLPELKILSAALVKQKDISSESLNLYSYLSKYIADIESGFRAANHTLAPTLEESLGFSKPEIPDIKFRNPEILLELYKQNNNTFLGMSALEISKLQQYRFENDLMTMEEETEFMKTLYPGVSIKTS